MLLLSASIILFFIVIAFIMYANWPVQSSGQSCSASSASSASSAGTQCGGGCPNCPCNKCGVPKPRCKCPISTGGCSFC